MVTVINGSKRKMMRILDYIFWRIYSFNSTHWILSDNEEGKAASLLYLIFGVPITILLASVTSCELIPIGAFFLTYFPLLHRYWWNKKVIANNYKLFADRWKEEDAKTHKRRGCMIIVLCIINLILFPICYVLLKKYHII